MQKMEPRSPPSARIRVKAGIDKNLAHRARTYGVPCAVVATMKSININGLANYTRDAG
jgi:hypothetical protein